MPKHGTVGNLALTGYNDIFQNTAITKMEGECIVEIPLSELHPPEFHPFLVLEDESMTRLVKSVKQYGVREPGLARTRADGGYELVVGNRRKRACELAEISTLPVIVREMDDDSAAIAMVDSNLEQREKLLYSERAWAYRVKLEALNHRGTKSDNPGELSVEILCEQTGESKNQIFRLIRLTYLIIGLFDKVDAKKLAFTPAVELSYLSITEQTEVASIMEKYETKPSLSQAQRLRKMKDAGELDAVAIDTVLAENKKAPKPDKGVSRFSKFFPSDYTTRQMNKVITELLTGWQTEQAQAQ